MAGIVGIAGLPSVIAAVQAGQTIALANKETLVSAGGLVMAEPNDAVRIFCLLIASIMQSFNVGRGGEDMGAGRWPKLT